MSYEAHPCYICRSKAYGVVEEKRDNWTPRYYCKRHFMPVYKRMMAAVEKSAKKDEPKQLSLL